MQDERIEISYYRILVEVDETFNGVGNVAALNIVTGEIDKWFNTISEAFEWAKENGKLMKLFE